MSPLPPTFQESFASLAAPIIRVSCSRGVSISPHQWLLALYTTSDRTSPNARNKTGVSAGMRGGGSMYEGSA
ncbi:hypothetical protein KM043_017179 [Ampulex compressa]|nr:hypothetical protein KM043_017179 [Ampulex compressa]